MNGCQPAIILVHPHYDSPGRVPTESVVTDVIVERLADAGWTASADPLVDVHARDVDIQDEVPPASPVTWPGVVAVFSQTQATFHHGYRGAFYFVLEGLHDAFPDFELYIDAVPQLSGTLTGGGD